MNRKVLIIIVIILLIVLGIGLIIYNKNRLKKEDKDSIKPNDNIENLNENVLFTVNENSITNKSAIFILENNSDDDYYFEPKYKIENNKGSGWGEIFIEEPLTFESILYTIKAKETKTIKIDWESSYGELPAGQYKIVKEVCKKTNDVTPKIIREEISASFEIK